MKHKTRFFWRPLRVAQWHELLVALVCLLSLMAFAAVLIRWAAYPGLVYCSDFFCAPLHPLHNRVGFVVIMTIMLSLGFVAALMLAFMPGTLMAEPLRFKFIAFTALFASVFGMMILYGSFTNASYVIPYRSVFPYTVDASRTDASSAVVSVSAYYSSYYANTGVIFRAYEVTAQTVGFQYFSPDSPPVYLDRQSSTPSPSAPLIRTVTGLHSGRYYFFMFSPAEMDSFRPPRQPFVRAPTLRTLPPAARDYTDQFLDLRGFRVCQWDAALGCQWLST